MENTFYPNEKSALQALAALDYAVKLKKYGSVPKDAIPASKFDSTTANGLTTCVIKLLMLKGHYCSRIQSQGQWRQDLGMWTPGTTRKGIGDVLAIINGRTIMLEVKIGADKQSQHQKETEEDVIASGGVYIIVRNFKDFLQWYHEIIKTKNFQLQNQ
jgi:hypothetical protein